MAKVFLNQYIWRKIIEYAGLSDDYKYKIINEYYMFTLPLDINKLYYYIINKFYSVASDWFLYLDELSECTYDYDDGIMYFTPPVITVSKDIKYNKKINDSKNIYNIFNNKLNIKFWLHFLSLDPDQTLFRLLRGITYKRIFI